MITKGTRVGIYVVAVVLIGIGIIFIDAQGFFFSNLSAYLLMVGIHLVMYNLVRTRGYDCVSSTEKGLIVFSVIMLIANIILMTDLGTMLDQGLIDAYTPATLSIPLAVTFILFNISALIAPYMSWREPRDTN